MKHEYFSFKTSSNSSEKTTTTKKIEFCGHTFNPENISRYSCEKKFLRWSEAKIHLKTGEIITLHCEYDDYIKTFGKVR